MNTIKSISAKFFSVVLLASLFVNANAKGNKQNTSSNVLTNATVEYVGNNGDASFFKIAINNDVDSKFLINILNEEGTSIHSQKVDASNYNKYIKVLNEGAENVAPIFIITDLNTGATQKFEAKVKQNLEKVVTLVKL
ncbi:hypothetical protein [Polluticaenibacter yanchengensis]|uniref:Uncharacterized protein n=1 Tax=Polluticaenibacter yanchengensis TaxID=3014562 RepID=A0ABT4UJE0_9BACT|nr:hypothetical protein [Chitinophagaceae bacterium LY-5]